MVIVSLLVLAISGCQLRSTQSANSSLAGANPNDFATTTQLLVTYCQACHAIGTDKKFIISENPKELLHYIQNEKAPSGHLWINSIIQVLSWPTPLPPENWGAFLDARRYMPIGQKKYAIAEPDSTSGLNDRELILQSLTNLEPTTP